MQKPKTQIKHDNLVAQIVVLKQELGLVNEELTNKIKEKSSLNNELFSAKEEFRGVIKETNKLVLIFKEFDRKEEAAQKRLDNIKEEELALIDKIKADKKKEVERKRLDVKLINLSAQIEKDGLLLKVKQDEIDGLRNLSKDIDKQNKQTTKHKKNKEQEIAQLDYEIEKKLSKFNNQVQDKLKELLDIRQVIFSEQKKIEQPLLCLKREEVKLERRKRNFDIMVMRFNKTFQAKYPNVQLRV